MNCAIIGTNFVSEYFCKALNELGQAPYAVYSRTVEKGTDFARRFNIKTVYNKYAEMLSDQKIDAIYVASPNICHAEQSIAALRAGKHVLCEKPIATAGLELSAMRTAARESGKLLMEAMSPAYDPIVKKQKKFYRIWEK